MALEGINGISTNVTAAGNLKKAENTASQFQIKFPGGKPASKRVTEQNIETALNEISSSKAVKGLLSNSPIGLTDQPSKEDIENMGYGFYQTAHHIGAPVTYKSADGGTITVYNGKGEASAGEGSRKIVYQNGRYLQEMFYDENGKLTKGQIKIKDGVAGFTEQQFDFAVKDNKISTLIR